MIEEFSALFDVLEMLLTRGLTLVLVGYSVYVALKIVAGLASQQRPQWNRIPYTLLILAIGWVLISMLPAWNLQAMRLGFERAAPERDALRTEIETNWGARELLGLDSVNGLFGDEDPPPAPTPPPTDEVIPTPVPQATSTPHPTAEPTGTVIIVQPTMPPLPTATPSPTAQIAPTETPGWPPTPPVTRRP